MVERMDVVGVELTALQLRSDGREVPQEVVQPAVELLQQRVGAVLRDFLRNFHLVIGEERRDPGLDDRRRAVRSTICKRALLKRVQRPMVEREVRNPEVSDEARLVEQGRRRRSRQHEALLRAWRRG